MTLLHNQTNGQLKKEKKEAIYLFIYKKQTDPMNL